MAKASTRNRIGQYFRKYGFWRLAWRVVIVIVLRCRSAWRRVACHRNYVYVYDGPVAETDLPDGLTVMRFTLWEEVPGEIQEDLLKYGGSSYLESFQRELADKAVLWVGLMNGGVAGEMMSRAGRDVARWFVPLQDEDLVVFAGGTREEYRGRGIAPALHRFIRARELQEGGRAFTDCRVWNESSIRCIAKAGFRRIATMRPLPAPRPRR